MKKRSIVLALILLGITSGIQASSKRAREFNRNVQEVMHESSEEKKVFEIFDAENVRFIKQIKDMQDEINTIANQEERKKLQDKLHTKVEQVFVGDDKRRVIMLGGLAIDGTDTQKELRKHHNAEWAQIIFKIAFDGKYQEDIPDALVGFKHLLEPTPKMSPAMSELESICSKMKKLKLEPENEQDDGQKIEDFFERCFYVRKSIGKLSLELKEEKNRLLSILDKIMFANFGCDNKEEFLEMLRDGLCK